MLLLLTLTGTSPEGALFRATLNDEVVPPSSVWPEMLLISKKSLPETVGSAGVEGKCELSFKRTLNVEVVPSSLV